MRIVQITDLHIAPEGVDTFGVDVKRNLKAIVQKLKNLDYDFLVITGDFCFKAPSLDIYLWIKDQISILPVPIYAIGGNHDEISTMITGLSLSEKSVDGELFYKKLYLDQTFLFLDSSKSVMSEKQFAWLQNELKSLQGPLGIFTHYPPLKMGVPYMDDQHGFKSSTQLLDILTSYHHPIHIFTGHYHVEKTWSHKNLHNYITPSCFFQINMLQSSFAIDHYRTGFRIIDWTPEGVYSSVHYIDP